MSSAVVAVGRAREVRALAALTKLVATRVRGFDVLDVGALPHVLEALDDPRRGERRGAGISRAEHRALAIVEGVLRRVPGVPSTCLVRSLARFAAFAKLGLDVRFVMALRPDGDDVVGHAWVELDGAPFDESVDARLVETYAFPSRPVTHGPAIP